MLHPPCPFFRTARLVALTLALPLVTSTDAGARQSSAPAQRGIVVDTQDAVVVRAHVRVVGAQGEVIGNALTDEHGRFSVPSATATCRIHVSLTGFRPATASCGAQEIRLVLTPAPVSETMVVSATRDVAPTSQVGSAVTVFTGDDIDRRGTPAVAELLRATPGVTVVRTGGAGGQSSLFVRGGESSYNKVLLDGIPLNEPGGTFNFSNLSTEQIERVEIVRGAESALFGSDAMSSVVQLFTRQARTPGLHGALSAEFGSHEWLRGSASVSARRGASDVSLTVALAHTDNHVPNNVFENTTAAWSTGGAPGGRIVLRSTGRVESQHSGTPGATAFGRPDLDAFFDRTDIVGGVSANVDAGSLAQRVSYAYSRSRQTSQNLVEDPPFTPQFGDRVGEFEFFDFLFDSLNRLERHHVSYQADWRPVTRATAGTHFLTAAIDWDGERAVLDNRMSGVRIPAARNNTGATVQHQLVLSRLSIVSGLRVEWNDAFGTAVVPRLTAAAELRRGGGAVGQTLVKATAGAGVKEPTILQSYSPSSFFLGNPDLEPERSRGVSLGVEQRLGADRAKIEVIWFDHRYRDQISTRTVSISPFVSQYFNIGRTRARGLELTATIAPAATVRGRGGYTRLDSEIVESTSPFNPLFQAGQPAFRRPRHSGFLDVAWTRGSVDVSLSGLFVGSRVDSDFAELVPPIAEAPAHALWTAAARYRIGAKVDWSLHLENLTDAEYMEPIGYPAWGRTARTAIRVRF